MNLVFLIFKTVLSMSVSGSFLIMILLVGKRFLKNKCSRQWQYYIWLIVVLRLVLPFDPKINLMGNVYQIFDRTVTQALLPAGQENSRQDTDDFAVYSENVTQGIQKAAQLEGISDEKRLSEWQNKLSAGKEKPEDGISVFLNGIGWVWLLIALGMLIRKITAYQSFVRYVAAGTEAVSNVALLEELSTAATQIRVNRSVELGVNPLLSSPMLTGIFHPCIILPDADISPKDFRYIALHELTHCKRRDIFYKWLVQTVVCLHWFNPFVHFMSREINNACEFSCDEAVLKKTGYKDAQDYGRTLLDAMAAVGRYKESSAAITLSANKQLLKERLGAIMSCGEKSRAVRVLTAVLTICVILGAVFVGLYPAQADVAAASEPAVMTEGQEEVALAKDSEKEASWESGIITGRIEALYEAGSLPGFQLAFGRIDEENQGVWLDRIYRDGEIAFFSVGLDQINADSPLIEHFAQKAYADGSLSFFSVLADHMEKDALEKWLDKAITDQSVSFQSVLFDRMDMDEEKDAWEVELEKKQLEEYRAVGVTKKGKNYYYQGQLVNIFLDMRPNYSFYTLDINPEGTVNIKILRGKDGQITGVAYLTEEEFRELFGDMGEELTEEYPRIMYVNANVLVCNVRAGAGEEYAVVGMLSQEEEVTVLEMVEGSGERNWYRIDKESLPEDMGISTEECYIRSDLLQEK